MHRPIESARATEAVECDLLVVGAGPAGSIAALVAARRGLSVMLVDKARFPRDKVCGCCLSAAAVDHLHQLGLTQAIQRAGAIQLAQLRVAARGRSARLDLPGGAALSRAVFDQALALHAAAAGARFMPNTSASLAGLDARRRAVLLQCADGPGTLRARLVIAADGLAGRFTQPLETLASRPAIHSRIGVASILDAHAPAYRPHVIHMACGSGGYVGLVRLEDGRLNVAAALDPRCVQRQGGVGQAVAAVLSEAGLEPIAALAPAHWSGTPALTRRPAAVATDRLLLVGDAAGYIEPFTGEGMAWALAGGEAAGNIAADALAAQWDAPRLSMQWTKTIAALLRSRQRHCRILTLALRSTLLTGLAVRLLASRPTLAAPLVRRFTAPVLLRPSHGGSRP